MKGKKRMFRSELGILNRKRRGMNGLNISVNSGIVKDKGGDNKGCSKENQSKPKLNRFCNESKVDEDV